MEPSTASRRWTAELGRPLGSASGDSARLYVAADDSTLFAIDPANGNRLWSRTLPFPFTAGATPVGELLIVAGLDGHLVGLAAATGETVWSIALGGPFISRPAVNGESLVIGSPSGLVWYLDARTGAVRGRFRLDDPVLVTPVFVDGLWIVAGERGVLAACRWKEAS